ncbi:putative O-methyltransferase [Rhizodiscina lignyota]|uniref:O-methyltransferase n=1 Tax=Rhizodiscina lignyota TaxID=1504668 RepID=A0A9P4IK48_9PEZI|nr:putative O-methyltransferase [Rhizodiscina lignyota]
MSSSIVSALEDLEAVDKSSLLDNMAERRKALQLARKLCVQLESPMDTIFRISWTDPAYNAAMKACVDLKVLDILQSRQGFVPVADLSEATGADASLLHRLLRHLAAMGAVDEQQPDSYRATALSNAMLRNEINGGLDFWFDVGTPVFSGMPSFLAKSGYRSQPVDEAGIWKAAKNTNSTFYEYMSEHPREMASFASHMSGYTSDRGVWTEIYPLERLLKGADDSSSLIVDKQYGFQPGRLVVQDLPLVIEQAKLKVDKNVTLMGHDLFTAQPVKGARAYFLHCVLHDFTDERAIDILNTLKPAFKPGYSKLILNECVIPSVGANPLTTGLDLIMMGCFGSRERSQVEWEALLERAGFRIVSVWTDTTVAWDSIIEAELV